MYAWNTFQDETLKSDRFLPVLAMVVQFNTDAKHNARVIFG